MKLTWTGLNGHDGPVEAYAYTGGKAFDPALPCVVFVHGALHDHSVWTLLARWCAHHGHSVLAVDLPGHGRSAGPALATAQDLGAWLLALMRAAGVRPQSGTTVVGHSMGALIGLEAAAQAPDCVQRLVMVGATYPMKVSDALLATAASDPLKAIDMVNAFSLSTLAAKPSYPSPGAWLHGSNRALMRRTLAGRHAGGCAVNLFHHDFSLCNSYQAGWQAAARVSARVTMVLGAHDQMTPPRTAQELAKALQARVQMLAAGHSLQAEAPDALLDALRTALAA